MANDRICVAMIVKDEAEVLPRALASLVGKVGAVLLHDTGSTDATPKLARSWFAATGTLGYMVVNVPFADFGSAYTEVLTRARSLAADTDCDWLLLMHADMELLGDPAAAHPGGTSADALNLAIEDGVRDYRVPLLLRANTAWRFVGRTHEYLDTADASPYVRADFDGISLRHYGDGSRRPRKLAEDLELLTAAHAADPTDARTLFYLAQTHRDLGEYARAAELYRERARLGGWDQEVFYSHYQAGLAAMRGGEHAAAAADLFAAWGSCPQRAAEPLYALANLAARCDWGELALELATLAARAAATGVPAGLFVDRYVYEALTGVEQVALAGV